jgi:hypothetical protein
MARASVLETWAHLLAVGRPLPTLPLWLADDLAVPLELEATYDGDVSHPPHPVTRARLGAAVEFLSEALQHGAHAAPAKDPERLLKVSVLLSQV